MRKSATMFLALCAMLAAPAAAQEEKPDPLIETGRELTALFFSGSDDAKLWDRFGDRMKQAMGSAENIKNFRAQVAQQLGTEKDVTEETVTEAQGFRVYLRTSTFSGHEGPILTQWAVDAEGKIGGFFIRPKP